MKNVLLVLIGFILGFAITWTLWINHVHFFGRTAATSSQHPAAISPANRPPSPQAALVNPFREYHFAREKTLADNPELAAEYKSLLSQVAEQEDAMNAAMIQVDPKVAPIIAKLVAMRKQNVSQHAIQASPPPTPLHS